VGVPNHFRQGGGAWGCLESHRSVLRDALMKGYRRILILEDDLDLWPDFRVKVSQTLANVPSSWDCLFLGCQHMGPTQPVAPGVVRATNAQRTHAYAVSRGFMRELYRAWSGPIDKHCDWFLGPFSGRFKTYAADPAIAGQVGGKSDIKGSFKRPEWWIRPPECAVVVLLDCSKEVMDQLRVRNWHSGYDRDGNGADRGLAAIFSDSSPRHQKIARLRKWVMDIQWEVSSLYGGVLSIWHPGADEELIREACPCSLMKISAESAEAAVAQLGLAKARGAVIPAVAVCETPSLLVMESDSGR
jgi:hypothetical protein